MWEGNRRRASGEDDGKTGSWWDGRIKQIKAKSKEFPSSPWEMYHVTYKSGSTEVTPHSPWELFDKDYKIAGWELPSMPASMKEAILSAMNDIERASFKVSVCLHPPFSPLPICCIRCLISCIVRFTLVVHTIWSHFQYQFFMFVGSIWGRATSRGCQG